MIYLTQIDRQLFTRIQNMYTVRGQAGSVLGVYACNNFEQRLPQIKMIKKCETTVDDFDRSPLKITVVFLVLLMLYSGQVDDDHGALKIAFSHSFRVCCLYLRKKSAA